MFTTLKSRLQDVRTLADLCTAAERIARTQGNDVPGSEHYVLAALELPDGTARAAFELLDIDAARFAAALDAVHREALDTLGIVAAAGAGRVLPAALRPQPAMFESAPSGEALMQRLAATRSLRRSRTLQGAHVLEAVAEEEHSLAARAFRSLGIGRERLAAAARVVAGAPPAV